jgi:hypothetical protein
MKNLYKYLFFFIIGLILFILLNSKDRFSIGGPAWAVPKSSTQDPNARDSWDQYNYYYSDDPLYTVEYITNTYLAPIIISDFPDRVGNDNTFTYTPNGDTPGAWNGYPIEFVHYPPEQVGGGLGLPDRPQVPGFGEMLDLPGGGPGGIGSAISSLFMRSSCATTSQRHYIYIITGNIIQKIRSDEYYTVSNTVNLTEEQFGILQILLTQCNDDEGETVLSILRSDRAGKFLSDLRHLVKLYDIEADPILLKSILVLYTNTGVSVQILTDLHITFTQIYQSDKFTIYEASITPGERQEYESNLEIIKNLLERSGDTHITDEHILTNSDGKAYVLTETVQINENPGIPSVDESIEMVEFIRCRVFLNFDATGSYPKYSIIDYTTFPIGYDYGILFFKLLYKSDPTQHPFIRFGQPATEDSDPTDALPIPDTISSFRRLFYLSVTPGRGFIGEGDAPRITLFTPTILDMRIIYTEEIYDAFLNIAIAKRLGTHDIQLRLMLLDYEQLNQLIKDIEEEDIDDAIILTRLQSIYDAMVEKYSL